MNQKKEFFLKRWFLRAFGPRKEMDILAEEQVQTPFRTFLKNFLHKKSAMTGLIIFLCILLFVIIGPKFWLLDLSEQDSTLVNMPPSSDLMNVPKELEGNVADIAAGVNYSVGTDHDGNIYTWGHTRISEKIDIKDVPQAVRDADIQMIAAGSDHVVAIDNSGELYIWGNTRLQQDKLSSDMKKAMKSGENWDIVQLEASNQFSAAVSSEGNLYLWGNGNMADIKIRSKFQGNIAKVALTTNEYIALLKDGTVAYTGYKDKGSPFAAIPAVLEGKVVTDVAATSRTVAAITEDGQIIVWGNTASGESKVPQLSVKPISLYGGRYHYTALLEDGSVVSWGNNRYKQIEVPAVLGNHKVASIYTGNYQNYAVTDEGQVITWGLKGFVLGSDDLGRDMLSRIVNGGKVTMTVGAISVIIATIIGVLLGGLAGYFGGKIDMLVMRIAEIVGGLPFIPFAMILSAVIGTRIDPTQRMYLIMVVLGVLSWTPTCRLVRAQILAQREMEYVTAAKAMGIREVAIVFRHILPNVFSLLLVSMTLDFATCMLTESTLSYLGFGIPLPTPTWGNLLNGANNSIVIQQYWWRWVFPATIFGACTVCINLIGDGLRDALDPKSNER